MGAAVEKSLPPLGPIERLVSNEKASNAAMVLRGRCVVVM